MAFPFDIYIQFCKKKNRIKLFLNNYILSSSFLLQVVLIPWTWYMPPNTLDSYKSRQKAYKFFLTTVLD